MKVIVTGSRGLTGGAILRMQDKYPEYELIPINRSHGDLTVEEDVKKLYDQFKPEMVIHAAAAVGGLGANLAHHGRFFRDNILMNTHMIHYAMLNKVEKFLAFSSMCVFPDHLTSINEESMHSGPAYKSNFAYAYAKRMVDVMISAYKEQYNIKNYCSIFPSNQYGPNDWYHLEDGHVVGVLMNKIYTAKKTGGLFEVWGDGSALREFIYINDVAKCCLDILKNDNLPQSLMITGKIQYSIKQLVDALCKVTDFPLERVYWNTDKPNGQHFRLSDKTQFNQYFPDFQYTPLEEGLKLSWDWFVENYEVARK